eukprot:456628-Rhodomonas_salina.4
MCRWVNLALEYRRGIASDGPVSLGYQQWQHRSHRDRDWDRLLHCAPGGRRVFRWSALSPAQCHGAGFTGTNLKGIKSNPGVARPGTRAVTV